MYAVINRCKWGAGEQSVADTPGAIQCSNYPAMLAIVDAMTGRASVVGIPSVARRLREQGRVYVAPAPGMVGALVERIR